MNWCTLRNIASNYKGIFFMNSNNQMKVEFLIVSNITCSDGCFIYGNQMNNIISKNLQIEDIKGRIGSIIVVDFNNTVKIDFLKSKNLIAYD